jgi:catechol 2,3-dioxygenase-like lactoylglutathione lyase family enzyme
MTAQLNHIIVYSADRAKSARFLAEILGLRAPRVGEMTRYWRLSRIRRLGTRRFFVRP